MKVALLGTRGVPARYGGFETCVEEVGARLAERGHDVIVYSRRPSTPTKRAHQAYRGMSVVWLPAARRSGAGDPQPHSPVGGASAPPPPGHRRRGDVQRRQRADCCPRCERPASRWPPTSTAWSGCARKWGAAGRRYYRQAESLAVRWSDALIADAPGIQEYYRAAFDAPTVLISYGAPVVPDAGDRLGELGLEPHGFHLVVARFEPENHVAEIVEGYVASDARLPLVVVGSAPYAAEYTRRVHAAADDRVRFMGGSMGPGPPRPVVRERHDLCARPLGRRYQPVVAASHRRRQPRRSPMTSSSTVVSWLK